MWKEMLFTAMNRLVDSVADVFSLAKNRLTEQAMTEWGEVTAILMTIDFLGVIGKFNKAVSDVMERWLSVSGKIIDQQNPVWQEMIFTAVEGLVDDTREIFNLAVARSPEGTDIGLPEWVSVQNCLDALRSDGENHSAFLLDLGYFKDAWVALAGKLAALPSV